MHRAQPKWSRIALFVILGLVAGGALGMALSRAIASPLRSATWADMPAQAREDYVMLVAAAYSIDGDLDQARTRLERLDAPNVGQWIAPLVRSLFQPSPPKTNGKMGLPISTQALPHSTAASLATSTARTC